MAHAGLGASYSMHGLSNKGIEHLERALQLDSGNFVAHVFLANLLVGKGRPEAARDHLEQAFVRADVSDFQRELARVSLLSGEQGEASAHIARGLALVAQEAAPYRERDAMGWKWGFGQLLELEKRPAEALRQYTRSLRVHHWRRWIHTRIAALLRGEDSVELEEALDELIASFDAIEKENAGLSPELLRTLALARIYHPDAHERSGALVPARLAVERTEGKDPAILRGLAEVEARSGDLREAVKALEAALSLPGANPYLEVPLARYRDQLLPHFASYANADAFVEASDRILVREEADWRYFQGTREPSDGIRWTEVEFDDAGWDSGAAPFGYGVGGNLNPRYRTYLDDMPRATTVYLRHDFQVSDPALLKRLSLYVWTEAGFVAYLNGHEVARFGAGVPGTVVPHTALGAGSSSVDVPSLVRIDAEALQAGVNCLAIQGVETVGGRRGLFFNALLRGEKLPDAEQVQRVMEELSLSVQGAKDESLLRYLEGRVLQEAGSVLEAAERFRSVVLEDPVAPRPRLRLAECLSAAGDSSAVESLLREFPVNHHETTRDLWDLWIRICLLDLDMGAGDILSDFRGSSMTEAVHFQSSPVDELSATPWKSPERSRTISRSRRTRRCHRSLSQFT